MQTPRTPPPYPRTRTAAAINSKRLLRRPVKPVKRKKRIGLRIDVVHQLLNGAHPLANRLKFSLEKEKLN